MKKLLGEAYWYIVNTCVESDINEIRIRIDRKINIKTLYGDFAVPYIANKDYIENIIKVATNESAYAYEEQMSQGYIDYKNGIRIGLVGDGWVRDGKIIYKSIYALCVRIPREITVDSEKINGIINNFDNTILVSPPGCGKTTLLRGIATQLAGKYDVFIIDERSEICGRELTLQRGEKCDVLQGIPKKLAFETAIRTMSPQIIVCDELFGDEDYYVVKRIAFAGIKVLASFHSDGQIPDSLDKVFSNKIVLSSIPGVGSIKSIICRAQTECDKK